MAREHWTLWVCTNCIHHHANGECRDCHEESHEGGEPLSLVDHTKSTMGLLYSEHSEECALYIHGCDTPNDYECDCETVTFTTSSCDGCGSGYHGERHAMTEWSE